MGSEEKIKLPEIKLLFTATCVLKAVKKKNTVICQNFHTGISGKLCLKENGCMKCQMTPIDLLFSLSFVGERN